jgi:hypothetical protein
VDLKTAFSKLKSSKGKPLYFFFCEGGEDGKPVLVMDSKKIPPQESKAILEKAKKKTKCSGRMEMNAANDLLVTPVGSCPSGLAKGIQAAARNASTLVFKDVVINPEEAEDGEGAAVPQAAPPGPSTDTEAEKTRLNDRLKQLIPAALEAQKAKSPTADALRLGISQVQAFASRQDFAPAHALLDRLEKLTNAPPKTKAEGGENRGLAEWTRARTEVVKQLMTCAKAVNETKLPGSQQAAIRLLSISKQLTAVPETEKQVAELERYLQGDEVIQAAEKFPAGNISIRNPLLMALAEVRKYLPS